MSACSSLFLSIITPDSARAALEVGLGVQVAVITGDRVLDILSIITRTLGGVPPRPVAVVAVILGVAMWCPVLECQIMETGAGRYDATGLVGVEVQVSPTCINAPRDKTK